jgi:hypothetical protein
MFACYNLYNLINMITHLWKCFVHYWRCFFCLDGGGFEPGAGGRIQESLNILITLDI